MKPLKLLVLAVALTAITPAAFAATLTDSETYGASELRAPFLSRGAGARAVGMGEAFVAVADDASAISWNPGGLGRLSGLSAVLVYDSMGEEMGMTYLAGAIPVGPGVAGLGFTALSYGELDLRDSTGIKTGTESPLDTAVVAAFAMPNPWGQGFGGLALEFIDEDVNGTFICASLGAIVPVMDTVNVGAALLHLGPSKDGFSPPAQIKLGGAYRARRDFELALDAAYGLIDEITWLALGAEYLFHPMATARIGYKHDVTGQGLDGMTGLTLGLSAIFKRLSLDYAYQPFGDLSNAHRIGLTYGGIARAL